MNLALLFPGVEVVGAHLFRVIRDTDMEISDDGETDLLESVDRTLKKLRHGAISLLQVEASMPTRVLETLCENFEIEDDGVVTRTDNRLDFSEWMSLHRLPLPHLKDPPFTPRVLWAAVHTGRPTCSTRSANRTGSFTTRSIRSPRSRPFSRRRPAIRTSPGSR